LNLLGEWTIISKVFFCTLEKNKVDITFKKFCYWRLISKCIKNVLISIHMKTYDQGELGMKRKPKSWEVIDSLGVLHKSGACFRHVVNELIIFQTIFNFHYFVKECNVIPNPPYSQPYLSNAHSYIENNCIQSLVSTRHFNNRLNVYVETSTWCNCFRCNVCS